jgi:Ca2+-binding RTX toxin-like protein
MATFSVTTLSDAAGAEGLSLREALTSANATAAADSIVFAAGVTGTIVLEQGVLTVTKDVTIDGGSAGVTIDAQGASRVLTTAAPFVDLTLEQLTLTNGSTTGSGGAILAGPRTTLTLEDSAVSDSTAGGSGGGVVATTLVLRDSVVEGNVARGLAGGGISAATVTLYQSTVSDNTVTGANAGVNDGGGGGIWASTSATLLYSTVSGNTAGNEFSAGGGVYSPIITVTNSTLAGNRAGYAGGAITPLEGQRASFTITDSTLTGNYAGSRGGAISGNATVANSIIIGNATGDTDPDVRGSVTSNGHNLFGSYVDGVVGDLDKVDPNTVFAATATIAGTSVLGGVLADNGGPTQTVALLDVAGNPAIGRGEPNALVRDQRGEPRPSPDGHSEIGAFEIEPSHPILRGTGGVKLLQGSGDTEALLGLSHAEVLRGGSGHDLLDGGRGADRLHGGPGGDVLIGGRGPDRFIFTEASHSAPALPDTILDFSQAEGDRIVLQNLDGDLDRPGQQPLEFIGRQRFTAAGQVMETVVDGQTLIRVNLDADLRAELRIELHDAIDLARADFVR